MSNNHGMMMNPGEFFQPLVKHRLNRSQATARPQRPRVHSTDPHQPALQPAASPAHVHSEAETWAPTPSQPRPEQVTHIDETMEQFDMFSTRKPRDMKAGTSSGLKSVTKGIVTGAVGLVAAPIQGAKSGGLQVRRTTAG